MSNRHIPRTILVLAALALPAAIALAGPPATPRRPAAERYWGVMVPDDYRWLENWSDPDVKKWVEAQNVWTRGSLDKIPSRPEVLKRVEALTRSISARYFGLQSRGGVLFALKDQPPKNQSMLVRLGSANDLSVDGSKVAVSLSKGGTESGDVHLFDTKTGAEIADVLPRVNGGTAGGDVAWTADGTGLWYTRYPAAGERPEPDRDFYQQLWFHKLGTHPGPDLTMVG